MSLMAAGVPIKSAVAGISCGLVTGDTDDDYIVLTDIQGLEDFFGDMDFKVAGTHKGITAIQMDIKIHGLTRPIVEEAIARTREARLYILDEVMAKAIDKPRDHVGEFAPKIVQIHIDPEKIGDVVGQRGKTINAIIEQTGVKIDITDDGAVSICGTDQAMMDRAVETDPDHCNRFQGRPAVRRNRSKHQRIWCLCGIRSWKRRHGTHLQDRQRAHQPGRGCSDPGR